MSRHIRAEFAAAVHMVDAWEEASGGYNYATARWRNFGTNELRRCYMKWTAAEYRAMHATRCGRRHRAKHHGRAITHWWMRAVRAQAVAIRNLHALRQPIDVQAKA